MVCLSLLVFICGLQQEHSGKTTAKIPVHRWLLLSADILKQDENTQQGTKNAGFN